jgi:L-asparaginase II
MDSADARTRALARIARAMGTYPYAVEGRGRTSTALMEATKGRVLSKGGAEGLLLMGLTDRGLGIAIKCEDGTSRAAGPAAVAVLEQLGALTGSEREALAKLRHPVVTNVVGLEVGFIEAGLREVALA